MSRRPSPWSRPWAWVAAAAVLLVLVRPCRPPFRRRAEIPIPQQAKDVVKTAKSYLPEENPPKSRPAPRDCSSYVQTVFRANGVKLPRTAAQMARQGRGVSPQELRMGDLVFFSGERAGRKVGHVGIFVHNGIFIHVPEGKVGAQLESLYIDYYKRRFLCARRLID